MPVSCVVIATVLIDNSSHSPQGLVPVSGGLRALYAGFLITGRKTLLGTWHSKTLLPTPGLNAPIQISVAVRAIVVWVQKVYSDVGKGKYLHHEVDNGRWVIAPQRARVHGPLYRSISPPPILALDSTFRCMHSKRTNFFVR